MDDFLPRLDAVRGEVLAHPQLELLDYQVRPPVSAEVLARVEERLGAALDPAVAAVYGQTNGVKLRWRVRAGLPDDEWEALHDLLGEDNLDATFADYGDEERSFAFVNLLPLEQALFEPHPNLYFDRDDLADDACSFKGQPLRWAEVRERLRPFDCFSLYGCAAFYLEPGRRSPDVLIPTDYY